MLCTPPAFILSQDQTLEIIVLKHRSLCDPISLLSSLALSFFYFLLSSILICKNFRDPFQAFRFVLLSCCSIFKDHFGQPLSRADLSIIPHLIRFVNTFFKSFSGFFKVFCEYFVGSSFWVSFNILPLFKEIVKHFFQFSSFLYL